MKIDLHCHTTLSDGSLGIEEVIAQAKKTGIDVLSITDHDTLSSYSRAAVLADRYGVKIIQGVEMSAWDKQRNQKVHILCYAPKKPDRLEGLCLKCCEIRKSCSKEMIDKVRKLYPISEESVLKHATGSKSIFKQHIMRALIEYGYALEFYGALNDELFNLKNGTCLVEREYPDVKFVLELIRAARGVSVMAHPAQYDNIELLEELAAEGCSVDCSVGDCAPECVLERLHLVGRRVESERISRAVEGLACKDDALAVRVDSAQ